MLKVFLFLGVFFTTTLTFSQQSVEMREAEYSLKSIYRQILAEISYSSRDSLNAVFYRSFKEALMRQRSFSYPFDSIPIGKLTSPDGRFRIFTWNIPQPGGYQKYFGLMQVKNADGDVKLVELIDGRNDIKDPRNDKLTAQRWMAALYYQLVSFNSTFGPAYVLLGSDFNNLFTSKKIIEVLTFDTHGNPVFGLPVFNVDGKYRLSRIVFEFSARASMVLRYSDEGKTIVFDHLSPSQSIFTGDFQYYGPDGSFDGFKLEDTEWVYVRDLDLRNPRRPKPKPIDAPVDIKEPEFIYIPYNKSIK